MKINESWIFKFLYIDNKKLLKLINKSGLEINNTLKFNNIHKIISGKIINITYYKDNKYLIELNINKFKNIIIKQNIEYKDFLKDSIVIIIFLKKKYNNIFIYTPKILNINNDNNVIILYKNTELGINLQNLLIPNFNIIDINIPNNRLDCFNVLGICNEISITNNINLYLPFSNLKIKPYINKKVEINIKNKNICSKYLGFFIDKIIETYNTPIDIKEKLIHSNFKIENNINDLINYIFLETGYCINIFNNFNLYNDKIIIKLIDHDSYYLINNKNTLIYKNTLVIFNKYNQILHIPGLIINNINDFNNIFIGCGSFNYELINFNKNKYKNYFIEKNEIEVNKNLILSILKYFLKILSNICKINYSNINKSKSFDLRKYINLNINKLYKFLGFKIKYKNIINILNKLKFKFYINKNNNNFLKVEIPKIRSDINIKEDLFEEIIRIYGYNKISKCKKSVLYSYLNNVENINKFNNKKDIINKIKNFLIFNGFNEIISYSLINKDKQYLIHKNTNQINIINPISENMSSIRISLLIGLLETIKFNENRQKNNIKIFEHGFCFYYFNKNILSKEIISGIIYGNKKNDFLKIKSNKLFDFYDIKGNVEDILLFFYSKNDFLLIKNKENNIFNLNKSLKIIDIKKNILIGYLGYLNNEIIEIFKLKNNVIYFEIYINNINIYNKYIHINKIYNNPINKRDISITINNNINIYEIINYLYEIKNNKTIKLNLIDYYKENDLYSNFTIRFYIQDKYKTLVDFDINNIINFYISKIKNKFNIKIKN